MEESELEKENKFKLINIESELNAYSLVDNFKNIKKNFDMIEGWITLKTCEIAFLFKSIDKLKNENKDPLIATIEKFSREEFKERYPDLVENQEKITKPFVDFDNLKIFIDEHVLNKNKIPHKCPVCDGSTEVHKYDNGKYIRLIKCISCNGKGIVWG